MTWKAIDWYLQNTCVTYQISELSSMLVPLIWLAQRRIIFDFVQSFFAAAVVVVVVFLLQPFFQSSLDKSQKIKIKVPFDT